MKARLIVVILTVVVASSALPASAHVAAKVTPVGSDGCDGKTVKRGERLLKLESGGEERSYFRYIPRGYDGKTPTPVVLDLHGTSEPVTFHKNGTALGPYGDKQGFITITPEGSSPPPMWDTNIDSPDMVFLVDLLDHLEQELCIDTRREFVTGYSNGAMVASVFACELSDRIAAIAPVAGIRNPPGCAPERPVPVVAFHGIADEWIAYEGGLGPGPYSLPPEETQRLIEIANPTESGLSIPEVTAAWAARNGCDATPSEEPVASDVALIAYSCPDHSAVQLYAIDGAGHTWPGSKVFVGLESFIGPTTLSIDARELMWDFFRKHPLREQSYQTT